MGNQRGSKRKNRKARGQVQKRVASAAAARLKRRQTLYPRFVLDKGDAPDGLVELVKTGLRAIDFDDDSQFNSGHRQFFKRHREIGFDAAFKEVKAMIEDESQRNLVRFGLLNHFGSLLFRLIPRTELLRYIPYNDICVTPTGAGCAVMLRSLKSSKTEHGTVYYSPHEPKVEIEGESRIVGFTRHAIERTCKRLEARDWTDYTGLGDVFAFFYECLYFEPITLSDGQFAVSFFDMVPPGHISTVIADSVIPDRDPSLTWYFREGYFVVVPNGPFWVAKTCLFPGYTQTPEYQALYKGLPRHNQAEILWKARQQTKKKLIESDDFSLVKRFHDAGVPQIVSIEGDLFKPFVNVPKEKESWEEIW